MTNAAASIPKRVVRSEPWEYDFTERPPRLTVAPGERFVVETEDAANGTLRTPGDLAVPETLGADRLRRMEFNPCAGPIAVEGAQPGDVLAVHIHDIVPADQGVTAIVPGTGPLADASRYPEWREPYTRIIRHEPGPSGTTSDGTAIFGERISWPLDPHVGTLAVAAERPVAAGADSCGGQGAFGGNLDCRLFAKGSTVLLGVEVPGACLYLGDVHASMGDGELHGMGDECRAEVTLSCEIRRGVSLPFARVETPTHVVQLNANRPLELAIHEAFGWVVNWLVDEHGYDPREAFMLMGAHPEVRIGVHQVCTSGRLRYVCSVACPKALLP